MSIDVRPLAKVADVDDAVKQMVLAVPDFSVGDTLHVALVNTLEGATPGHHSEPFGTGQAFRQVFFPQWAPGPHHDVSSTIPGFADWTGFSVAVLCQAMYNLTSDTLHEQLDPTAITNAVAAYNGRLNDNLAPVYAAVFARSWSDFADPLGKVTDRASALHQYRSVLLSQVDLHEIWYASGTWKHPEWEMYHHWVKMLTLGATVAEIDALIGQLQTAGLTIEPTVVGGVWTRFDGFLLDDPLIDGSSVQGDARTKILEATQGPGVGTDPPQPSPEGNSYEFTADGQPGEKYRTRSTSSSCFASDTRVRMGDGSLRPIADISVGDIVMTPDGPRPVALRTSPFLAGRQRFRIAGESFSFTASQPFVAVEAPQGPSLFAIDAHHVRTAIPTLGHRGVAHLKTGAAIAGIEPGAVEETPIVVRAVVPTDEAPIEEHVFDLVVTPRPAETGEIYVAGATGRCFRVRPEIPIFADAPSATVALLVAAEQSLDAYVEYIEGADEAGLRRALQRLGDGACATVVSCAMQEVGPAGQSQPGSGAAADVYEFVGRRLGLFDTGDRWRDAAVSAYIDMLIARLGAELNVACSFPWRRITREPGEHLSVSVGSMHLFEGLEAAAGTLAVSWTGGSPVAREAGADATTIIGPGELAWSHTIVYDNVVYFDAGSSAAASVLLNVSRTDGQTLAQARVEMPDHRLSYRRMRPTLRGADGTGVAQIFADVRRLTWDVVQQEQGEASSGSGGAGFDHALALGREIGDHLSRSMRRLQAARGEST